LNRLRYLAMLQRQPTEQPARWWDLMKWVRNSTETKSAQQEGVRPERIPESILVGLAALDHNHLDYAALSLTAGSEQSVSSVVVTAQKTIQEHNSEFDGNWAKAGNYKQAFDRMVRGVKVS